MNRSEVTTNLLTKASQDLIETEILLSYVTRQGLTKPSQERDKASAQLQGKINSLKEWTAYLEDIQKELTK